MIDVAVVYKVDRLTRSLIDFAKMVGLSDARARVVRCRHLERDRTDNEQIQRSDSGNVIAQESLPTLGPWLVVPDHVPADGGFTDLDAQHQQFPVDPRCAHSGFSRLSRRISLRSSVYRIRSNREYATHNFIKENSP